MPRIIDKFLSRIEFDATTDSRLSRSVEWTASPVESGLDVTDHARELPNEITLSGVFTDTPISGLTLPDAARRAYEQLIAVMQAREPVTVVLGFAVLTSMGITNVEAMVDTQTGEAIGVKVSLREVRIVQSVTVPIPPEILALEAKAGAQSEADAGIQSSPPTDTATDAAVNQSVASSIEDAVLGNASFEDILRR